MASVSSLAQNLNYLQPTGYKVIIDRKYYPNLEFFCQTFQHPGMTATAAELPYQRIGSIPFQADKLTFGELILTIIVDTELDLSKLFIVRCVSTETFRVICVECFPFIFSHLYMNLCHFY